MNDFANRLRKLRADRNLTQEETSIELGISRSTLGMYETGKREPDFETLETIADFFNVDMNYLIGYSDTPHDWEREANVSGICPPNDFEGAPEDWYRMKSAADEDYALEQKQNHNHVTSLIEDSGLKNLVSTYNILNEPNRDKVVNYAEKLLGIQRLDDESSDLLNAAHDKGATEEEKINADSIMMNDDEWM